MTSAGDTLASRLLTLRNKGLSNEEISASISWVILPEHIDRAIARVGAARTHGGVD